MTILTSDYKAVMKTVHQWPLHQRVALIQDLLKTVVAIEPEQNKRPQTFDLALGLLSTEIPAPSDEQVHEWLDERRMGKYS